MMTTAEKTMFLRRILDLSPNIPDKITCSTSLDAGAAPFIPPHAELGLPPTPVLNTTAPIVTPPVVSPPSTPSRQRHAHRMQRGRDFATPAPSGRPLRRRAFAALPLHDQFLLPVILSLFPATIILSALLQNLIIGGQYFSPPHTAQRHQRQTAPYPYQKHLHHHHQWQQTLLHPSSPTFLPAKKLSEKEKKVRFKRNVQEIPKYTLGKS